MEAPALARFLADWQNISSPRRGGDALVEVIGSLQGLAVTASVLESDILSSRITGYTPADLDALCTSGEVVWIGAGPVGACDGRVRLLFRDQAALLVGPTDAAADSSTDPAGATGEADIGAGSVSSLLHEALRTHLQQRGASFWPQLVAAAHEADLAYDDASVLDALWDLVWAGVVTNDSLAPLRARIGAPARQANRRRAASPARARGRRPSLGRPALARPSVGGLSRSGPPSAAGRWSLVAPLLEPAPTPTERAHAQALQLLERHGVLTRESVLGEGVEGGFAGIYPVLKALEERGQVRRGYFVAGLGAAQFAPPGAVDRLRSFRDDIEQDPPAVVLASSDPAQPFGAALPWPPSEGRPGRTAGSYVVLVGGELVAFLERGARTLATFHATDRHRRWAEGVVELVKDGRLRRIEITRIDGQPVADSPHAQALRDAGFAEGYRGLTLRA